MCVRDRGVFSDSIFFLSDPCNPEISATVGLFYTKVSVAVSWVMEKLCSLLKHLPSAVESLSAFLCMVQVDGKLVYVTTRKDHVFIPAHKKLCSAADCCAQVFQFLWSLCSAFFARVIFIIIF